MYILLLSASDFSFHAHLVLFVHPKLKIRCALRGARWSKDHLLPSRKLLWETWNVIKLASFTVILILTAIAMKAHPHNM